jgi:hypothetical protein
MLGLESSRLNSPSSGVVSAEEVSNGLAPNCCSSSSPSDGALPTGMSRPVSSPVTKSLLHQDSCLPALGAQYDAFAAAAAARRSGLDVTSALEALVSLERERFDS